MTVEDDRFYAVARQDIRARQTRRACADNRHFFTGLFHAGHIRTPAHLERFIVDIALNVADGHCAELIVQGAGTFAQTVLRADTSAHFRQGIGLMRQFCRFKNTPLVGELQPVRDVVVYRAFPLAVWVAARQAAVSLRFGLAFGKRLVNFNKLNFADLQRFLWRINALQVDKLINILTHCCYPLLRLHAQLCCATTTVTQQCFYITGLRFNQRKFSGEG